MCKLKIPFEKQQTSDFVFYLNWKEGEHKTQHQNAGEQWTAIESSNSISSIHSAHFQLSAK